jgi:hypothetical protein
MKLGTNDIGSVYLGTNAVQKVYLGTNEVWSAGGLLLNDYPNAAVAYSLRLLRSAYTGDAIRVRRASDNDELEIGFVNNVLDTATLESFCTSTDGFVTTWYDQSGNSNDWTQSTAGSQPQIVSSGTVILENGKPSLQFDGSDDELISSAISTISLESIFIVNTPYNDVSGLLGGSGSTPYLAISSTDARYRTTVLNTLQPLTSNANLSLNSFNRSSNTISAYRNSVVSATTLTGDALINIDRIGRRGGSAAYSGNVSECIIYDFDQAANRANIESNMINFYGL